MCAVKKRKIKRCLLLAQLFGLSQLFLYTQLIESVQAANQTNVRQKTGSSSSSMRLQVPPAPRVIVPQTNVARPVPTGSNNVTQTNDQVVLQSRDISSYGPSWQTFTDYLTVPRGYEQIPLSLLFTNGHGNGPRFTDLRISLAGKQLATIKDFGNGSILTRNLSGALGVGDSLLTIQAYGPLGAEFSWKFVTPRVVVNKVNPNAFALNDKVAIDGQNFSDRQGVTQVFIDNKPATVISANAGHLEIKPPANALGGKADLVVAVGPSRSQPYKVTIKSAPEIQAISLLSSPAGQPITISGKGFSAVAGENKVTIGGIPAQVVSCTPTTIDCIIPQPGSWWPSYDVPIKVTTNGVEAKDPENVARINIQVRVF